MDAALTAPVVLEAAVLAELDLPGVGFTTPTLATFSDAVLPAAVLETAGLPALDLAAPFLVAPDLAVLGLAMDELPALPRDAVGLDDAGGDVRFAPDFLSEVVFRAAAMGACHLDSRKRERKGAGS